jgi:hypothetical protein
MRIEIEGMPDPESGEITDDWLPVGKASESE